MPCIFCIAMFIAVAGAITSAIMDKLEGDLASVATAPVEKTADSESVAKFEFSVDPNTVIAERLRVRVRYRPVPVAVTVYKRQGRVRIQVLTHELPRDHAHVVQDYVAEAAGLNVVERSSPESERTVQQATQGGVATEAARSTERRSVRREET